jgi:hypothetical protein
VPNIESACELSESAGVVFGATKFEGPPSNRLVQKSSRLRPNARTLLPRARPRHWPAMRNFIAATPLQMQCAFTVNHSASRWLLLPYPSRARAPERRPTRRLQAPELRGRRPGVLRERRRRVPRESKRRVARVPRRVASPLARAEAEKPLRAEVRAVPQMLGIVPVLVRAETPEMQDEGGMARAA